MKQYKIFLDPQGYAFYHLRSKTMRFRSFFHTLFLRMRLSAKRIDHGKRIVTYGKTYVNRQPLSKIVIGDDVVFRSSFGSNLVGLNRPCMISTLGPEAAVVIGNGCGLSSTVIGAAQQIILGDRVLVGANTLITDTDWHNIHPDLRRAPCTSAKPVIIEDNVWLGINTVVLKGVHIGKNSIIAANSVVVRDIPENVIAGGNPCKVIKPLF